MDAESVRGWVQAVLCPDMPLTQFLKGGSIIHRDCWNPSGIAILIIYVYHLFAPHNSSGRQVLSLAPPYQWGNWGTRQWSHLPKITLEVGSNSEIQSRWAPEPGLCTTAVLCLPPVSGSCWELVPDKNRSWSHPKLSKTDCLGVHMRAYEPHCPKVVF